MRSLFPWSAPPGAPRPAFVTPGWWQVAAPAGLLVCLWGGTWPLRAGFGWPAALGTTALAGAAMGGLLCGVWQARAADAIRAKRVTPTTPRPLTRREVLGVTLGFTVLVLLLVAIAIVSGAGRAV